MHIKLPSLVDSRSTSHEQNRDVLYFSSTVILTVESLTQTGFCWVGILSPRWNSRMVSWIKKRHQSLRCRQHDWQMSEIPILSKLSLYTSVFFIAQQRYRPLIRSNIVYLQDILFRFHLWYKKTPEMCPPHPSIIASLCPANNGFQWPVSPLSPFITPAVSPPTHIYAFPVSLPWKCHKKGWQLQFIVALTGERSW